MCVHDGEAHVREAIDSILGQSYRDFELLIIDDGSADATPEVLASYSDSRIRILRNAENRGLTRSLNIGLREARGALVARQDADDRSHRERLARQVALLKCEPDVAAVGAQFVSIDERGRRRSSHFWMHCQTSLGIRWQLMFENPFVHSAVMFRRDVVLEGMGGYDETFRTNQDFELWSRLALVHPLRNLGEVLIALRSRRASISSHYNAEALRAVHEVFMRNIEATIGFQPAAAEGIDVVLRGTHPLVAGPPDALAPLELWIDAAYRSFVAIWPQAARLREIRAQSASLIARVATIAAKTSPLRMARWYLSAARYDLPTFARGTLGLARSGARALAARSSGAEQ